MAPPAHLIVVRHGSRLDVVDREWHRTSPTPYDSPLTYGGWLQAKALGARIATILTTASASTTTTTTTSTTPTTSNSSDPVAHAQPRKFRIVIHSSPFLRCVQTSIAIAAGISQPPQASLAISTSQVSPASASSATATPTAAVILPAINGQSLQKALLRIDPFLGEWLNPEYFEGITSPPSSNLMLAGAKADLLRKEEYEWLASGGREHGHGHGHGHGHLHKPSHGALWSSSTMANPTAPAPSLSAGTPNGLSSILQPIPSASFPQSSQSPAPTAGYVAPTPDYAVGIACPIPKGFVAHARDACVVSDYQWDSSREPLDWGDGGSAPEEWTTMHKRIRRGLQRLVDWYSFRDDACTPVTVTESKGRNTKDNDEVSDKDDNNDTDVETIVILVSHGACCNAMIGAITNKPVLLDVNVAALTMASRHHPVEPSPHLGRAADAQDAARQTIDLDKTYNITILANTDHYRSSRGAATPPPVMSWGGMSPYRSRVSSMSASVKPVVIRPSSYNMPIGSPVSHINQTPRFDGTHKRDRSASSTSMPSPSVADLPYRTEVGSSEYTPEAMATTTRQPLLATPPTVRLSSSAPRFDVPRSGLWAPPAAKIRLLGADEEYDDDYDNMFPDFDHKQLSSSSSGTFGELKNHGVQEPKSDDDGASAPRERPTLLPPVELMSALAADNEEVIDDLPAAAALPPLLREGLWENNPRTEIKRRWTVNER